MQWQYVDMETPDELSLPQIPWKSIDIDILIGQESQTTQVVGPEALELLAQQLPADSGCELLHRTMAVAQLRKRGGALRQAGRPR